MEINRFSLIRFTKLVRIRQDYTEAWALLRTEALRREAEQLIFQ